MKNMGDGRRKSRVEKEVQHVVSEYIIQQMKNDIQGLVTVTRVQMPADFRGAEIFVTYYNPIESDETKNLDIVDVLQTWASDIQDEIANKLKMRYCPKVRFTYDQMTAHIVKIENILSQLAPGQKVVADDEESD